MYGKIFSSLFDSTLIAEGGWLPGWVFVSMIAIADKDGIVSLAPKALYKRIGSDNGVAGSIEFSSFVEALRYLAEPDANSNSIELEGRRIVPLSEIEEFDDNRGWLIVNYHSYRDKASKADKRTKSAERSFNYRQRQRGKL